MYPTHRPPTTPALYGPVAEINWPAFVARSAIRGAVLWPILRFLGGVSGPRAIVTAVGAGAALTGIELAFDATGALQMAERPEPVPPPIQVAGAGWTHGQPDQPQYIDVNGEVIP